VGRRGGRPAGGGGGGRQSPHLGLIQQLDLAQDRVTEGRCVPTTILGIFKTSKIVHSISVHQCDVQKPHQKLMAADWTSFHRLVSPTIAIILSVTAVLFFGEPTLPILRAIGGFGPPRDMLSPSAAGGALPRQTRHELPDCVFGWREGATVCQRSREAFKSSGTLLTFEALGKDLLSQKSRALRCSCEPFNETFGKINMIRLSARRTPPFFLATRSEFCSAADRLLSF